MTHLFLCHMISWLCSCFCSYVILTTQLFCVYIFSAGLWFTVYVLFFGHMWFSDYNYFFVIYLLCSYFCSHVIPTMPLYFFMFFWLQPWYFYFSSLKSMLFWLCHLLYVDFFWLRRLEMPNILYNIVSMMYLVFVFITIDSEIELRTIYCTRTNRGSWFSTFWCRVEI